MSDSYNPVTTKDTLLAMAIDELAEMFVLFDADDRIVLANKAWQELNQAVIDYSIPGVTFEEHLRAAISRKLIPDAIGREEDWLAERMDRHRNPRGPFFLARQDGRSVAIHEQRLPNGGTALIISDVTEQRQVSEQLRQSEERFQAFIRNLPAKMHIKDTQGRYLLINPVSEKLFGISNEDALGKTAADIFPGQKGELFGAHDRQVLTTGQPSTAEEQFTTKDGVRTYLTVKFPLFDAHGKVAAIGASGIDITERKNIELLLRKREQELNSVIESAPYFILRFDHECRAVFVNHLMTEALGVAPSDILGKTPVEGRPKEYSGLDNYYQKLQNVIRSGRSDEVQIIVKNRAGELRTHHINLIAERDPQGHIIGALVFGSDITARLQAEADLRIAAIAMDAQEAIAITDANRVIIKVNPAFTRITGYTADEAIGSTLSKMLRSGRYDEAFYQNMWNRVNQDKYWEGELLDRHKDGEIYPHRLNITAVMDNDGTITNYVIHITDITQQKQAEELIHSLAFFDPLTELPNRRLLEDRLQHTLASSTRNQRHGAILFIDLDNFKELNDTRGHGIGDLLLVEVARRLRSCVREDDTVARLGGDEFVIVLNDLNAAADQAAIQAENIAEKMRCAVIRGFDLDGASYHSSPSIGISLFQGDEISAEELLKRADTAMYQAKQSGRNTIRFFDPATHAAMEARIALEADLRNAIAENQLQLYYQMQVDYAGNIVGAEALLRWIHPRRGLVPPLQFIPLAEEVGLIIPIGHWVLEAACAQLKAWENNPVARHLQVSINVSASQLHRAEFVDQVCAVLRKTGIDPDKLKIELTESLMLDNVDETINKMKALKKLGVHFSMDDFGTGHSSLAYLTRLPLDQVKIDQSFVRHMGSKATDAVIVQTIIGMAKNLSMDVIAEGVETQEQRDFLEESGCFTYQGYLFGKPAPAEALELALLQRKRA